MARYTCTRCHVVCNTTDGEHLCKDLNKRYERQKKAIESINNVLVFYYGTAYSNAPANDILKLLSGRDLGFG